ncbi:hypothetical protein I79_004813 [Cricetulus griseus]|uniref:Uncharacterized protein n=1 Tax=Cricetulus griseus TaxID=10029 RepID=G3H3M4_CRIGR|nr:hypothetical protein I79_004813 [Cricetulus griseus]
MDAFSEFSSGATSGVLSYSCFALVFPILGEAENSTDTPLGENRAGAGPKCPLFRILLSSLALGLRPCLRAYDSSWSSLFFITSPAWLSDCHLLHRQTSSACAGQTLVPYVGISHIPRK